jgi:hypothetical protein
MHPLRSGYTESVGSVLELGGVNTERLKLREYEVWTTYGLVNGGNRLQRAEEDESRDSPGT